MRIAFILLIQISLLCTKIIYAQFPDFEYNEIASFGNKMGQTALVDVDRDGDLDWVVGSFGKMWWFEYINPDKWIHHDIGEGAKTDVGGTAIDIDNDGWIDFVAGTAWYRNTGNPVNEKFIKYDNGAISCHDNVVCDIDNDGNLDVIACSDNENHPYLVWYKIPDNPTEKWKGHKIGKGIHGGVDPKGIGDLDNDNDNDVVRGDSWFENINGIGTEWKEYKTLIPRGGNRPDKYGLALKSWVYDLDKDGDHDIIQAEADCKNGRVFWFENDQSGKNWIFHMISEDTTFQDFHSLAIADFDNDGDMDVFSGGGPLSQSEHKYIIWENLNGKGDNWVEHVILKGKRCHEAVAGDVDGDGDIDICSKPWNGNLHVYLRNMLMESKKN